MSPWEQHVAHVRWVDGDAGRDPVELIGVAATDVTMDQLESSGSAQQANIVGHRTEHAQHVAAACGGSMANEYSGWVAENQ